MKKQVLKMIDGETFTVVLDTEKAEKAYTVFRGNRNKRVVWKTNTMGEAMHFLYAWHMGAREFIKPDGTYAVIR